MSRVVSSAVLEALALELILKVRLNKAGIRIPKTHNHTALFEGLPALERQQAGQRYQTSRHAAMRPTIASMGEMQRAFNALLHGL
jgi:hypothetical protein